MKKPIYKRKWFIVLVVIFAIGIIGNLNKDNEASKKETKSASTETKITQTEPTKAATEAVTEAVTEAPKETEADIPKEYINALKSAETYAKNMHMSKQRIRDQLVSEYGEKFSEEAADYAMENLEADWKENALITAKNYQDSMHMSKEAIRDQLVSEYGEKFTQEEADYAVENLDD